MYRRYISIFGGPLRNAIFISACISFVAIFMLPESHYWLIRQGRLVEAKKAMETIRGSSFDISPEFDDIQMLQKEVWNGKRV